MKQFDQETLRQAYPEMTEAFAQRMNDMIQALPSREEEKQVKRKFSLGLALALILVILTTATAVAASLGVFAQLAETHDPDQRLGDLDAVAAQVGQSVTTSDGITVTIDQAYYDGERVFLSYQLSGNLVRTEESGRGEVDGAAWFDAGGYEIAIDPDSPLAAVVEEMRSAEKDSWVCVVSANLHDGISLTDGTYLDIIGGEERLLPDGTVIGWKECEVPKERAAEELNCKAVLFRTNNIYQQTGKGIRAAYSRGSEETDIPFTVRREAGVARLTGENQTDAYTARAECTLNGVDVKGTVTVQGQESWVRAWMDWDYQRDFDLIQSWVLYSGEERIGSEGNDRGVWGEGDTLYFEEILRHGGHTENLRLVPVYADSGEHPDEAIALTAK